MNPLQHKPTQPVTGNFETERRLVEGVTPRPHTLPSAFSPTERGVRRFLRHTQPFIVFAGSRWHGSCYEVQRCSSAFCGSTERLRGHSSHVLWYLSPNQNSDSSFASSRKVSSEQTEAREGSTGRRATGSGSVPPQKIPLAIFNPFCFMRGSVELATFLARTGRPKPRFFSTKS